MRDFRDAKAMARTLRAALDAKGLKITISQSLELIAEVFGVADWNTLAAAIRTEGTAPRNNASALPPLAETIPEPGVLFSRALELTLHRALAYANQRNHEYATLEHLLLALADDPDASAVMNGCEVDVATLKDYLTNYIGNELQNLVTEGAQDSKPTAAFQRVIQRAVIHVQSSGLKEVSGGHVLVAIFAERHSPGVSFLEQQNMTRSEAVNYISQQAVVSQQDVVRQSFSHGRTKAVVVEKVKRRAAPRDGQTGKNTE